MPKTSPLASVSATREVLEKHGLATKKALGQHFLISDGVIARILDLAEVSSDDTVVEVGPGIGTLTVALLGSAGAVVAIERDQDLPPVLAETCAEHADAFALICKDALDVTEADMRMALSGITEAAPCKLVSNLPYAVAATIVLDYLERFDFLLSETVMVQAEVADRMCAKPGTKDYGAYTVKLGLHAQVAGRFSVGPQNFFPPPRVDSAVVRLERCTPQRNGQALSRVQVAASCLMADASFANRRKTLANSCKTFFAGRGDEGRRAHKVLPDVFATVGIDPRRRGETLSVEEFTALGCALHAALDASE